MNAIAFDTHASVKRLIEAGVPEAQAEALVEVVSKTADLPDISQLATKSDIASLRSDVDQLRVSTTSEIAVLTARIGAVKGELIYWIIGVGAALAGLNIVQALHLGR